MNDVVRLVSQHGYVVIFIVVLAEAVGLPMPAALALIAAGAGVASHKLGAPFVLLVAAGAMFLGDSLLYVIGRQTGWTLLGFLCKLSVNPETCILRSAESFYKRGKLTLILAKFIPGVNTMAPPLAGSMKMPYDHFVLLDLAGALLYIMAYGTLGFVFRDLLAAVVTGIQSAGHLVEMVLVLALIGYTGYRIWLFSKHRIYRVVPRVQAVELARKLQSEDADSVFIVDVRSHGYYDSGAARIHGSVRIEPNNLKEEMKSLPRDKDIYVYCT